MNSVDYNKLSTMSKDELKESLAVAKKLIAAIEEELTRPDNFQLKYENEAWIVGWQSPSTAREATALNETIIKNGGYRMNSENALASARRRINANILEAIGEQLEPEYSPVYEDIKEEKCYIKYCTQTNQFEVEVNYSCGYIGAPVFSLQTAHIIKKMLNAGEIKLYKKDGRFESTKD